MAKLTDSDGIDGPFDRAMRKAMREDKKRVVVAAETITDEQPTQHIRSGGRLRADKRFRYHVRGSRAVVNRHPNLCGAVPDEMVDLDKATARHLLDCVSRGAPSTWTANLCARCAEILNTRAKELK